VREAADSCRPRIVLAMSGSESLRSFSRVFDGIADQYDAVRLGYPATLVDACMSRGGLRPGSRVLEVGCGTGKLTELLAARELEVVAVDPGPNMVEAARRRLGALNDRVRFQIATFEEARLPEAAFDGLFSATAFHWPDPAVSWQKAAFHLETGGLLALLTHVGLHDERVDEEFLELQMRHAPDVAATWRPPRNLATILAGAEERRANASAVWDWIMSDRHGLTVEPAAKLFDDVHVAAEVSRIEETADQAIAHLRTTSLYFRIHAASRPAFEEGMRRLVDRFGGAVETALATVLMTARRTRRK
jgi:SAM-dependent methyltransferase